MCVCACVFGRLHEAYLAPQAIHNKIVVEREVPHFGRIREARPAPILSKTPLRSGGAPPLYGEHTEEILLEHG